MNKVLKIVLVTAIAGSAYAVAPAGSQIPNQGICHSVNETVLSRDADSRRVVADATSNGLRQDLGIAEQSAATLVLTLSQANGPACFELAVGSASPAGVCAPNRPADPTSVTCERNQVSGLRVLLGAGDDSLQATDVTEAKQEVDGGDGDDTLATGAAGDTLRGNDGADRLSGLAGSDVLEGGAGSDPQLDGGDGNDTIRGAEGADTLAGATGADTLDGGPGTDDLDGGDGNDTLTGGDGHDAAVKGGGGDDNLRGGNGNDGVEGGDGNDTFTAEFTSTPTSVVGVEEITLDGNDTFSGGSGNDLALYVRPVRHVISLDDSANDGSPGESDNVKADVEDVTTGERNDRITAQSGDVANKLTSAAGNDVVIAGAGNDAVNAGSGDDSVDAGSGDDSVIAGSGDDSVDAGSGSDSVVAGNGNDVVRGGDGDDALHGEAGADEICGDNCTSGVGDDVLRGGSENDRLQGDDGNDQLFGDAPGGGVFNPGTGDDACNGEQGVDIEDQATCEKEQ